MLYRAEKDLNRCIKELKQYKTSPKVYTFSREQLDIIDEPIKKKINRVWEIASTFDCSIGIVGGFIRDLLLGRYSQDVDFVVFKGDIELLTNAIAKKMDAKVGKMDNKTLTTQIRFADDIVFEFNSTRKEEYEDNSRTPKVQEGTLYDDLHRRDFTINAFVMFGNKYIDIFYGTEHLNNKILQTTRTPDIVFEEDYLRMFRAIRFSSTLGFKISPEVKEGIIKNISSILTVPPERILEELKQSFLSNAKRTFTLMAELKVLQTLFPSIKNLQLNQELYMVSDVFTKIEEKFDFIKNSNEDYSLNSLFSVMFVEMKEKHKLLEDLVKDKLKSLKFSNASIEEISTYIKYRNILFTFALEEPSLLELRLFLRKIGQHIDQLILLTQAENAFRKQKINLEPVINRIDKLKDNKDLIYVKPVLDGNDINRLFGVEGKEIGEIKEMLIHAIMSEKIENTKRECREFISQYLTKIKEK